MRTIEGLSAAPNMDQKRKAFVLQEFQTTIVGMLGHELRQSLQVIQGTYALLRSRLEEMPQKTWLDRGERAATKLSEQLDRLVDAFYLAERYNTLEVSYVELGALFWQLRHENEEAALHRGIDLRTISTNAHVVSNPVLLGCIQGRQIRVDVYDTGIGIPEDQLPRIFESFTRLTPGRGEGLGIGLSVVRRALEVLGHRIEIRSVVGEGSHFSIYAPAAGQI
jgi:two-component system phosphate regulon sensor histidine kinase PhoR